MDLGSGSTYSENMSAASGGRGGSQNQAPSGFGGGDSGGGSPDPYAGYVQASKPRTGIAAIKDFITGDKYDYGYQRTLGNTFGGLGTLLLGAINPVLGLAARGYQAFKPEFQMFKNSPTIESFLNQRKNLYAEDELPTLTNKTLDYYNSIYNPLENILARRDLYQGPTYDFYQGDVGMSLNDIAPMDLTSGNIDQFGIGRFNP